MKRRIVILSAFFRPFRSGAEACAEEVARELAGRYDITVVTARLRRTLPKAEIIGGVHVVRVGTGTRIDKWLYPWLAARYLRTLKPDLIHAVLESFAGEALVRSEKTWPSAKRLLTCQSTNTTLRLKPIHAAAHRVTAISTVLVERAKKLGRHKVTLIPNGVRVADIEKERKRTAKVPGRVLFVGRLEPMKGIDVLLRAFAEAVQSGAADATLHIVGDGSLRRSLYKLARQLDISSRVTFVGYVAPPDVYGEFAQAQVFCGLSRSEALGNVFLEAQAAGCAILATRTGGIPDVVKDGETGLLVKPDSAKAAAESLQQLLNDAQLREHLAKAAIHNARGYDWSAIAEKYAAVYDEMMK